MADRDDVLDENESFDEEEFGDVEALDENAFGGDEEEAFEADTDLEDEEAAPVAADEAEELELEPEPSEEGPSGRPASAVALWPHGAKRNLFLTSLVGAVPAAVLTFLMVKVFLSFAGKTTGMLMVVAGITLALSAVVALTPVGIVLFSPKEMKAPPKAPKGARGTAEGAAGAAAESGGFGDIIPEDFASETAEATEAPAEADESEQPETEAEDESVEGGDDDEFAFEDDMATGDDGELSDLDFDIEEEDEDK